MTVMSTHDDNKVTSSNRSTRNSNEEESSSTELEELPNGLPALSSAISLNRKRKCRAIRTVLNRLSRGEPICATGDHTAILRQLAISAGGLIKDDYRRQIWPKLLLETKNGENEVEEWQKASEEELKCHKEWSQVEMDVYRTLARFPPDINDDQRSILQQQLTPMIVQILWLNHQFQYYQGFHDVCLTFLLVLGEPLAFKVCLHLSINGIFHRFLTEPLEESVPSNLCLIYVVLKQTDPELELFLRRAELGYLFGLSWLLTWFAHSLDNYAHVTRLYDLFVAAHPLMPVYFASALVLYRSSEILDNCACEMTQIHSLLSKMPVNLPLEALVSDAQDLFLQYPPSSLTGELKNRYESDVKREEEVRRAGGQVAFLPRLRLNPWRMAGLGNARNRALSVTFWAVTATAAAWYLYNHYGIDQLSWGQFMG